MPPSGVRFFSQMTAHFHVGQMLIFEPSATAGIFGQDLQSPWLLPFNGPPLFEQENGMGKQDLLGRKGICSTASTSSGVWKASLVLKASRGYALFKHVILKIVSGS